MKKIILAILAVAALALTGCNKTILDLTYKFKKVHVFETQQCYEINDWKDYEGDQIQVGIKGYGKVLFHSNQIALIEDNCPFCD